MLLFNAQIHISIMVLVTNLGGSDLTGHTLCMRQHQCVVFTHSSAVHYIVMNVVLYRDHISTTVSGG